MKANSIELLKDAYGGTFEENVKTVLTKHFDSDSAEKLWNQIVEKYPKAEYFRRRRRRGVLHFAVSCCVQSFRRIRRVGEGGCQFG